MTRCDHLTNFGALFDVNGSLGDWDAVQMEILNYLSIVLMSLSILASSATVVILQFSRWQLSHMKLDILILTNLLQIAFKSPNCNCQEQSNQHHRIVCPLPPRL